MRAREAVARRVERWERSSIAILRGTEFFRNGARATIQRCVPGVWRLPGPLLLSTLIRVCALGSARSACAGIGLGALVASTMH